MRIMLLSALWVSIEIGWLPDNRFEYCPASLWMFNSEYGECHEIVF